MPATAATEAELTDLIWCAMDNRSDMDTSLTDYAQAVAAMLIRDGVVVLRPPPVSEIDLPDGWQQAQAAKCGCRGSDDLCACQNEYAPEKYGLQVTEKCGDCGLLASSLLHRFCERQECPVRASLARQAG